MIKNLKVFITIISALLVYTLTWSQTGIEIMKKNEAQLHASSSQVKNVMTLINKKGNKRVREITRFTIDDGTNSSLLIRFTQPADIKGTGLLDIENTDRDNDRWLFLPALNQSRRISSSNISDSFMSTDFTYEDIGEEELEEYTYKLVKTDKYNNQDCFVIEAFAKNDKRKKESGYTKRLLYVSKEHYLIVYAKYFDKKK